MTIQVDPRVLTPEEKERWSKDPEFQRSEQAQLERRVKERSGADGHVEGEIQTEEGDVLLRIFATGQNAWVS